MFELRYLPKSMIGESGVGCITFYSDGIFSLRMAGRAVAHTPIYVKLNPSSTNYACNIFFLLLQFVL